MEKPNTEKPKAEKKNPTSSNNSSRDKPKKERVLHTRVPEILDAELKRLAESLRVPVSNVVRAILTDAVEAADTVGQMAEGEIRGVADRLRSQRDKLRNHTSDALRVGPPLPKPTESNDSRRRDADQPPLPPLAGVIGFQPLLIARTSACAVCGGALNAGTQAYIGITDRAGHTPIVGPECLPFSQPNAANGDGADK